MTKKTVYKAIGAASYDDFNKAVNVAVAEGWSKTDATVFSQDGIHTCLSAEVEQVLLDFPKKAEIEMRAHEFYNENLSSLQPLLQFTSVAHPKTLPAGVLCELTLIGDAGRFEYNERLFELARAKSKNTDVPEFVVVCRANAAERVHGVQIGYQI